MAEHGVVRWRRADLSQVIATRYGVQLAERSVGALLARLGFRYISVRPHNPDHGKDSVHAFTQASDNTGAPCCSKGTPTRHRRAYPVLGVSTYPEPIPDRLTLLHLPGVSPPLCLWRATSRTRGHTCKRLQSSVAVLAIIAGFGSRSLTMAAR